MVRGKEINKIASSSKRMYIRNTSDILPGWEDILNSYISSNWADMRSISHMNELSEINLEP